MILSSSSIHLLLLFLILAAMEEIYGGRGVVEREKSVLGRGGRRGGAGGQPHEQEKVRVGGPTWAKGGVGWLGLALSRLFFFYVLQQP